MNVAVAIVAVAVTGESKILVRPTTLNDAMTNGARANGVEAAPDLLPAVAVG